MAILAGAFNGLLATLFSLMKGVGGYSGWRWIFIMEERLRHSLLPAYRSQGSRLPLHVSTGPLDPYLHNSMGPRFLLYLVKFAYPNAIPNCLSGCLITTIGLAIDIAQPKQADVKYLGLFFLTAGNYIVMPITVVWLAINIQKGYKRAAALSIIIPVGNSSAICSSNVIITSESPVFNTGIATGLGMSMLSLFAMTVLYLDLRLQNKRKDQGISGENKDDEGSANIRYPL